MVVKAIGVAMSIIGDNCLAWAGGLWQSSVSCWLLLACLFLADGAVVLVGVACVAGGKTSGGW